MGKFKLEYDVKKGIFLAPKSYMLEMEDDTHIIKHKGPAKDFVTSEWFQKQLADPSQTEQIPSHENFRIDWNQLKIFKKEIHLKLGIPQSTKRENVYDSSNVWIDTRSINVIDIGNQDATTIYKYELLRINRESVSQSGQKTTTVQPTLYNTKPKKEGKKAGKKGNYITPNLRIKRPKPDRKER